MPKALLFLTTSLPVGFGRGLMRAWVLMLVLVAGFTVARIAQLWHLWPQGFSPRFAEMAMVFWQGLRFDLKASASIAAAGLWLWPWLSGKQHQAVATFVLGGVMVLAAINVNYFAFYKTPIDDLIFGLIEDDTGAVLSTIWHDFPVIRSLALAIIATAALALAHRRLLRIVEPKIAPWRYSRIAALVLTLLALFGLAACIKGTWRAIGLQRQHTAVTTSPLLNDMVPNSGMALYFAFGARSQSQDGLQPLSGLNALGFETPMQAAATLRWPSGNEQEVAEAIFQVPPKPKGTARDTFVVLMESWGAEPLRYQNRDFDVAGRLNSVWPQACHFSNFDSAQNGTHPTLEALLFATPVTPLTQSALGRVPIPWSIPRMYQAAGYRTIFVTSGRARWRDLDKVLHAQGFDEVVDASHLSERFPQAEIGVWGVWDRYLFDYLKSMSRESSKQPLFVFALTVSNHPPYDLPEDYSPMKLDMALWKGELADGHLEKSLQTYRYSTDLLGDFVAHASQGRSAPLIAATGDHNLRTFGSYASIDRRALKQQVPFMIWNAGRPCPTNMRQPASHRDLFPTVMPLAGIGGGVRSGRNLFADASAQDPVAVRFTGEARNELGEWQLGRPGSWICNRRDVPAGACRFDARADERARAELALLDWQTRRFRQQIIKRKLP